MDSNKDEGAKCMAIGKAAMESGDRIRALKFLTKAKRLYPNPQVDAYLSALYEGNGKQAADEKPSVARTESMDSRISEKEENGNAGLRQRNGLHRAGSSTAASSTGGAEGSAEQIETVARIRRCRDYYQILGLSKECSDEDVRKAYRKISLKVHPDKNKADGAEEAFKSVSKAFHTLSDAELREKYDRYGPEEEQEQHSFVRRRRAGTQGNPVFYDDMFEANDIFNAFFFGMQPQAGGGFRRAHYTRAPAGGGRQENHSSNFIGLLQLLPILALFLFSYFPFSQPVYQLEKSDSYQYLHKTKHNGVPYYVKSTDFYKNYPTGSSNRRQLEYSVERDYRDLLAHYCRVEQSYQRWGQRRAMPNCEKLQTFVPG